MRMQKNEKSCNRGDRCLIHKGEITTCASLFCLYREGYGYLRVIVAREWLIDCYNLARSTTHQNLNNRKLYIDNS